MSLQNQVKQEEDITDMSMMKINWSKRSSNLTRQLRLKLKIAMKNWLENNYKRYQQGLWKLISKMYLLSHKVLKALLLRMIYDSTYGLKCILIILNLDFQRLFHKSFHLAKKQDLILFSVQTKFSNSKALFHIGLTKFINSNS